MTITVKDAFGAVRGTAEVKWVRADYGDTGPDGPRNEEEESAMIFDPELTVILPTKNAQMPWRLEVVI